MSLQKKLIERRRHGFKLLVKLTCNAPGYKIAFKNFLHIMIILQTSEDLFPGHVEFSILSFQQKNSLQACFNPLKTNAYRYRSGLK